MKYLVLAVLLSVMQASPPVSRQAADANASKGQSVQNGAKANEKPPKPQAAVAQKVQATPNENANPSKRDDDAPHPVRIRELPPVSIVRDWMDVIALAFSGILLIVGICGVNAAYRTLKAIEQQVGEMKAQREITQGQLGQMEKQTGELKAAADIALIAADVATENAR